MPTLEESEPALEDEAVRQPATRTRPEVLLAPVLEAIAETPLPPIEEAEERKAAAIGSIPETPAFEVGAIHEALPLAALTPLPGIQETPLPPVERPQLAPLPRRRLGRPALTLLLLALFAGSSLLLWRDASAAHLYVYTLDPTDGHILAQQDIGGSYQDAGMLTNLVQVQSSLLFGVQASASAQAQQVFSISGGDTAWHVDGQVSVPLAHSALGTTRDEKLVIAYAGGVQVMTPGGHLLWQLHGEEPARGAHFFQPAFDDKMLYTLQSSTRGLVAAYDLHSGALRWMQRLDDTFDYAPPFVLDGERLYVAGDHLLYALDRSDGSVLWKAFCPARTLLLENDGQPLLVAAGASGLTAFDPATGKLAWLFKGLPRDAAQAASLTPAQFYQAAVSRAHNVIYAPGIVWDVQQVREQLWLFAVDAATGAPRWSERIGSGLASADAGRIFSPLVDTAPGLVLLEQAQEDGSHTISAFATNDGSERWSTRLQGVMAAAPALLQTSSQALIALSVQTDAQAALHSWSPGRLALLVIGGLSVLVLLCLWLLPLQVRVGQIAHALRHLPRALVYPFTLLLRLWRFSHLVTGLLLAILLVSGSALAYLPLSGLHTYLNQLAASSGSTQWQQVTDTPVQLVQADAQGSIILTSDGAHLQRLAALNTSGAAQWTTFSSEGAFSLSPLPARPGTLLVALSGRTESHYRLAPDDPAYPYPLEHLFRLYLLSRTTGQVIWESTIVQAEEQQQASVLAADGHCIYVASRATAPSFPGPGQGAVVQLIAVDQASGTIAWRIFGPAEPQAEAPDYGKLLTQGRMLYWQVAQTIYALDSVAGQIQWRRAIAEPLPGIFPQEEGALAAGAGVLLVGRSDLYHALDLASGSERWTIPTPGDGSPAGGGVVAVRNLFIVYSGGTLEAIDPAEQHLVWKQEHLGAIRGLLVSDDMGLLYAVMATGGEHSPQRQALAAFDVKTGAVRWRFQPSTQTRFVQPDGAGLQYQHGTIFATMCVAAVQGACEREALYALDASSGAITWKVEARRISNVQVSADDSIVLFQASSSGWEQLLERFSG